MMIRAVIFLFSQIFVYNTICRAQIIPDSIRVDWSKAGFEGIIPDYNTIVDVSAFGAIPNDNIDDYSAVANAISALNNKAGVVYFPAGNYIIKSTINLPDSVIIRGAGSDSTTLSFNFNNATANSINIQKGQAGSFLPVQAGYTKGSDQLIVSNASSVFSAGDDIEMREANGSWDTNPATWATYLVGHLSKVAAVNGDTLWLSEALRINFDAALLPEIRKISLRQMCGLECFKMMRTDSGATSVNYGVYFSYAGNCWMRGVESYKSLGAHVAIETSSHISISGCYFHESYLYDGTSTNGYGVMLISHSCSNLIEDNIFKKLRHAMITKQGANGNVFGYNYSIQPNRSETPADLGADLCLHGHYAFANLYEGNIGQNLIIDQTWGSSGPFNTFFRNKLELYGIIMSSGSSVQSDRQNFVGNDVTNTTFPYGQYILAGSNHFLYGNNIKGTIMPSGTTSLTDTSYYLDSIPPHFWNINNALPSIGIPNNPANDNNPARQRYINGGMLTLCSPPDSLITKTPLIEKSNDSFIIRNCFAEDGVIKLFVESERECRNAVVEIYSATGQRLLMRTINVKKGSSSYAFKAAISLSSGFYFLRVNINEKIFTKKLLIGSSRQQ